MNTLRLHLLAPSSHLKAIQEGLVSLGHTVVSACDPNTLAGEVTEFSGADIVFTALDSSVEDAMERLDEALDQSEAEVLFDEAENRENWSSDRWAQHLQPKLLKVCNRLQGMQAPKDPTPPESLTGLEDMEWLATPLPEHTSSAASLEESLDTEPEYRLDIQQITSLEGASSEGNVASLDGGYDFFDDSDSAGLFSIPKDDEALQPEEPAETEPSPLPFEPIAEPAPPMEAPSPTVEWDPDTFELMEHQEEVPLQSKAVARTELETPAWTLDDETTEALPSELEISPAPQVDSKADTPAPTGSHSIIEAAPFADEAQGFVLVAGGLGGPGALVGLMPHLPAQLPVPILVHQPLPQGKHEVFVKNLQRHTTIPVHLAQTGQTPTPGEIWLMAENHTLELATKGWVVVEGAIDSLVEDASDQHALVLVSGAPPQWVIPAMNAASNGTLLLGQDPSEALEPQTISTLSEIGLVTGAAAEIGLQLAERWGVEP